MEFIFNNLNNGNIQEKCNELRELMEDECMLLMAQYWVAKHAIDEPNFHVLYSDLLDCLKEPVFHKMIIYETLRNIRILLDADKTIADCSDRTQLKNLGHWLGMITLGRNKPILHIDIDMKALLIEAYNKGPHEVLYVVPFVARILENCSYSRIFRPPNPWTMAIIKVLAELFAEPDLESALECEITLLCKSLGIDVEKLKRTNYLENPAQRHTLEHQLSYNRQIPINNSEQQQYCLDQSILKQVVGVTKSGPMITPLFQQSVEELRSRFHYLDITSTGIAQNAHLLTINDDLPLFRIFPHLVHLVGPAIERAIFECFETVLNRSIGIALITSQYIVRKDFALDLEEMKIRKAARYMACNLAAGMTMNLCRDQIVTLINRHLIQVFGGASMPLTSQQKQFAEEAADIVAADNMELACVFMQKNAIERALPEMDRRLLIELELRRNTRLEGRNYFDALEQYEAKNIPHRLRLQDYGVTAQQMLLYEEFASNIPGFAPLLGHEVQTIFALNLDRSVSCYDGCIDPNVHFGFRQLQVRDVVNPPSFIVRSKNLWHEWVSLYHSDHYMRDPNKTSAAFIRLMETQGIFRSDRCITQFFELTIQMCVDMSYCALVQEYVARSSVRAKCFYTLDAFVRLVVLLIKNSGEAYYTTFKINLLDRVLRILASALLQDHETRGGNFHQLPYHRILILLFIELYALQNVREEYSHQMLSVFCRILHMLRPSKAPGFCYAWLELIGYRTFLQRVMELEQPYDCVRMYSQLWEDLFEFLTPFLRNNMSAHPFIVFYKGTLRILLVLLHDFPTFLCLYSDRFCEIIPSNCIQMRNVILSAYPRRLHVTDPFSPALNVDMLDGILDAPNSTPNRSTMSLPNNLTTKLTKYLMTAAPESFLSDLRQKLQVSQEPGTNYNIRLMNAVVLFVGIRGVKFIRSNRDELDMSTFPHSPHRDVFQYLAVNLDTEGRYLLFNAIVNQLRYPNNRTYYFSCILLYLFGTAETQIIQEQISRVLLERLIVNKPHPWGLLTTFMELIKNPIYKFWTLDFVHCAPNIEKLIGFMAELCRVDIPTTSNQESAEY